MAVGSSFFQQLFDSIAESGRELIGRPVADGTRPTRALADLCHALLSQRGEASGAALAVDALAAYQALSDAQRRQFFTLLVDEFSPDPEAIGEAAEAYARDPSPQHLSALGRIVEPPRQELFRRINMAPGGTAALVEMRRALLAALRDAPQFCGIDDDLRHLFMSWFNRGFLRLRRIDWTTPASLLEKLIAYESVHPIQSWDDLRRRVASDRRCFAFFHPALPDEPLIFVEIALVKGMAGRIQPLLDLDAPPRDPASADCAIFYSINNCQDGLRGITFGNFLIKQVAAELAAEFPNLRTFATLSPIPGLRRWLVDEGARLAVEQGDGSLQETLAQLEDPAWPTRVEADELRSRLLPHAAWYLTEARERGRPLDPVARFHLGNGARLERLNWLADVSANGLAQSAGMMVNYVYSLDQVERNHEAYVNDGLVVASRGVRNLARQAPQAHRQLRPAEPAPQPA